MAQRTTRKKVKVPLYGQPAGRVANIEDGATLGAAFDSTLFYADGRVVTLANLAEALALDELGAADNDIPLARTLWGLIQEIPSNIVQLAALSTAGMIVRTGDGRILTRDEPNVGAALAWAEDAGDREYTPPAVIERITNVLPPHEHAAFGYPLSFEVDAEDPPVVPGTRGADGAAGSTGASGSPGPAIYLQADDPEDPIIVPGDRGPTGSAGGAGPAGAQGLPLFFLAEDPEEPLMIPGPQGIQGPGGGGGGSLTVGSAVLDFGAFPGASDASVAVTGQAGIVAGSVVNAWLVATASADHSADEHLIESVKVIAGNIVAGTGFTIYGVNDSELFEQLEAGGVGRPAVTTLGGQGAYPREWVGGRGTRLYGQFNVRWQWQ
jgi:hypothetical protein